MTTASFTKGIVLFAHGSRDPLWHQPIEAVAAQIASQSAHTPVICAYLEISSPDLAAATATLAARGVRCIRVLPLFLGVGKHAREDLPRLVADLKVSHPDIEFDLQPAVGEDARLVALLAQIAMDGH